MKNWYGLKNIWFIYHGDYSDPELEYKGVRFNEHCIEDALWDSYCEKCGSEATLEGFAEYLRENEEEVYDVADTFLEYSQTVNRQ